MTVPVKLSHIDVLTTSILEQRRYTADKDKPSRSSKEKEPQKRLSLEKRQDGRAQTLNDLEKKKKASGFKVTPRYLDSVCDDVHLCERFRGRFNDVHLYQGVFNEVHLYQGCF